ncbi:4940_t:CDS:2, partial [Racocetra persica]
EVPNIQSIVPDAEIGYILEVDLEASVHLHDYFTDYPLALEKQIIPENWLSLYNEILVRDKNVGEEKYVSGKKLSPWIKEYIEENIHKRKIAKANGDEFGVVYYKLKNNAVFGKQMKNVRKHMRVELPRTEEDKKIRRLASSPLF